MKKVLFKKIGIALICAVVAAVCALAFVGCTRFQNDGEQADPIPDSGVYDSEGNMLVSGEVYDVNRGLVFAMPTAESVSASEGITLQATIEPEAAKDWPLEWSVLAAPGVSDCAECKEKIKLEPAGRTCVVKCEGNFLHQLKIEVRPIGGDDGVKSSCIVDYRSKMGVDLAYNADASYSAAILQAGFWSDMKQDTNFNQIAYQWGQIEEDATKIRFMPFFSNWTNYETLLKHLYVIPVFKFVQGTDFSAFNVLTDLMNLNVVSTFTIVAIGKAELGDYCTGDSWILSHDVMSEGVFEVSPDYSGDEGAARFNGFAAYGYPNGKIPMGEHASVVKFYPKVNVSMYDVMFSSWGFESVPQKSVFNKYVGALDEVIMNNKTLCDVYMNFSITTLRLESVGNSMTWGTSSVFGIEKTTFTGKQLTASPTNVSLNQATLEF